MNTLLAQAEPIWLALQAVWPGISVEVLPSCTSTNTLLLDRARSGDTSACLLVAQEQTAGRGRLGRRWIAPPEAALTFSLALPLAPLHWDGLSLVAGIVLAETLDPGGGHIALKWPNDLWLRDASALPAGGRKLGGILVETVAVGDQRMMVLGVGLNVAPAPEALADAGLSSGYACLQEIDPSATVAATLTRVAGPLLEGLRQFAETGFGAWHSRFAARDLLAGRPVRTTGSTERVGRAEGVDEHGALLLRDDPGTVHRISSGEVSVRPHEAIA